MNGKIIHSYRREAMFRAIYENFANERGAQMPPAAADYLAYQRAQQQNYDKLANPIIVQDERVKDVLKNSAGVFATSVPVTDGALSRDLDLANNVVSTDIPQYLKDKQAVCTKAALPSLVDTYNPLDKVRCGWIYEKGAMGNPPKVSVGAIGTRTGPLQFFSNPKGKWYWDLDEALKAQEKDHCMNMRRCEDVKDAKYVGKCMYDKKRGYGVPVDEKGLIKYGDDPFVGGSGANLIGSADKCPQPPAPGSPQDIVRRSIDVCTPRADGSYSRDCMLQQVTAAGCKREGTLYNALASMAAPNNYGAGLVQNSAFQQYQNRNKAPLLSGIVKDGRIATDVALANVKELAAQAAGTGSGSERSAIHYAARDLCLEKGYFDKFDFCWDLTPNSQPPFRLDCLQREFLKNGGQSAGKAFPTAANKAQLWDKLGSWQEVQGAMKKMGVDARSAEGTMGDQSSQISQLLGIQREKPSEMIEKIVGADIYWFDRDRGGVFLGRRISQNGLVVPFFSTNGVVENSGKADMVEFCMVTNMRPSRTQEVRLTIETDDSARIYLNRDHINNEKDAQLRGQDTADVMDRWWSQAPTRHVQKNCWKLEADKPNYLTAWWQEDYGQAHWLMYYSACKQGAALSHISPMMYSLTQEPDAPMLSFGVKSSVSGAASQFMEYRLAGAFPTLAGPGIQMVSVKKHPAFTKYGFGAKLGANGLIKVNKQIAISSFRTMSIGFVVDQLPGVGAEGVLCMVGNLRISVVNRMGRAMVRTRYTSGGANVELLSSGDDQALVVGKPYIYTMKMVSVENDMIPTKMIIQVAPADAAKGMQYPQAGYSHTYVTQNNNPLYSRGDSGVIMLGDPNGVASANVTVVYCDLYDYEMNSAQYQRGAMNDWARAWII